MLRKYAHHVLDERYIWVDVQGNFEGGDLLGYEFNVTANGACSHAELVVTDPPGLPYLFALQNVSL